MYPRRYFIKRHGTEMKSLKLSLHSKLTILFLYFEVCSVSCGGDHTVALSEDGNVYVFGQSTNGQLGLGTRSLETSHPLKITSLSELCNGINKIVQISCGENHIRLELLASKGFI